MQLRGRVIAPIRNRVVRPSARQPLLLLPQIGVCLHNGHFRLGASQRGSLGVAVTLFSLQRPKNIKHEGFFPLLPAAADEHGLMHSEYASSAGGLRDG